MGSDPPGGIEGCWRVRADSARLLPGERGGFDVAFAGEFPAARFRPWFLLPPIFVTRCIEELRR